MDTSHAETLCANPADGGAESAGLRPGLPPGVRLLCLCRDEPPWLRLALAFEAEGCHEPRLRWVTSAAEALAASRQEQFDCVLVVADEVERTGSSIQGENRVSRQEPSGAAPGLIHCAQALRAGGHDEALLVVASSLADETWVELVDTGGEVLVTPQGLNSPALVPALRRAVERVEIDRECRRLELTHQRRMVRERTEAEHLLTQQRQMIEEMHSWGQTLRVEDRESRIEGRIAGDPHHDSGPGPSPKSGGVLPQEFATYYQELLRTYVIMGSGSLSGEIAQVARWMCDAGLGPSAALELHVERVEALVRGLGNRSARHVMSRADLLALELAIHLGERYRGLAGDG